MVKATRISVLSEILRGASVTLVLTIIGYACMFFFKLLIARYLGATEYGYFELVNTVFGVLAIVAALGVSAGVTRYVAEYTVKKKTSYLKGYLRFALGLPLLMSVAVAGIAWFIAPAITNYLGYGSSFTTLTRIVVLFIPLRLFNEILSFSLQAEKKVFQSTFGFNVIERVVLIVGACIIIAMGWGTSAIIALIGISIITSTAYHLYAAKHFLRLVLSAEQTKYAVKEWLLFSLPLFFTTVFTYILSWTDNFIIAANLPVDQLGIYGIAYSFASYLMFIPTIFYTLFMPIITELASKRRSNLVPVVVHVRNWSVLVALFFAAIFIVFAKPLLTLLYGTSYAGGGASLVMLSVCFCIAIYFSCYNSILILKKDTNFLFYVATGCALFNLALSIILVKHMQTIFAVAIGSGISMVLLKVLEYRRSRQYLKVPFSGQLLMKALLVTVIAASTAKLLSPYAFALAHPLVAVVGLLAIYTIVFGVLLLVLRVMTAEDEALLQMVEAKLGINLSFLRRLFLRN